MQWMDGGDAYGHAIRCGKYCTVAGVGVGDQGARTNINWNAGWFARLTG